VDRTSTGVLKSNFGDYGLELSPDGRLASLPKNAGQVNAMGPLARFSYRYR
jgi:hypothetical protein